MRRFSLSNGSPLEAEEGQDVICIVPYSEWTSGFSAGEEIRVLTSTGERRATVLHDTQVHPMDAVPEDIARQAGFASAREVAERNRESARQLAAVVRFRVHEVLTMRRTFRDMLLWAIGMKTQ